MPHYDFLFAHWARDILLDEIKSVENTYLLKDIPVVLKILEEIDK